MTLTDRYAELCATPSDIWQHLPILHDLVLSERAAHVVELGTRTGVSTVAFLHALEQTGGRLTSVDVDEPPAIDSERWTFIRGDDLDPLTVARIDPADIVFVDTSHAYEHTLRELHTYRWVARSWIVCHDTALEHPMGVPLRPAFPVRVAVEEFCRETGFRWRDHGPWPGLGVIDVRSR